MIIPDHFVFDFISNPGHAWMQVDNVYLRHFKFKPTSYSQLNATFRSSKRIVMLLASCLYCASMVFRTH